MPTFEQGAQPSMVAPPQASASASGRRGHRRRRATPAALARSSAVAVAVARAAALLALPRAAAAHSLPYVPTQILTPDACFNRSACHGRDVAYILTQGSDDGDGGVQFLSLNISGMVGAATALGAATSRVPFLGARSSGKGTAFGAARTEDGAVVVYAGGCEQGLGSVWTYGDGAGGGGSGDEAWTQKTTTTTTDSSGRSASRGPPYFLGGTIAFSATLAPTLDQPTIYTYGGMCPTPPSNASNWQSAANYTKAMMSLAPAENSPDAGSSYALGLASSAGPRTPMAGFSLTPLLTSLSNVSGTVTQQTAYVVLGGHTKEAFINMSTAAVWKLPEESWSYVNVLQPGGTEPAAGQASAGPRATVDSRSGHTAVLSEDQRSIVVLGGWVGDVSNAAEPQLAVLDMSQAYSSWRWTVPTDQPASIGGVGIYGHGAALLPGNVMMVYGGWEVGSSGSSRMRRQAGSTAPPQFLNLTSMSWSTSYSNPRPDTSGARGPHDAPGTAGTSSKTKRLGLGLGLGLGLALTSIIIAALGFFCCRARQRRKAARDETIRAMAQDANVFLHDHDEMAERDGILLPWGHGGAGSYGAGYAPVVPGIARKPLARQLRGGYGSAANSQLSNGLISPPGRIHPILEDDEEDAGHQRIRTSELTTPTSEALSDPFLTPIAAAASGALPVLCPPAGRWSATPSPESNPRYDADVQDWVTDVDAADAMLARYNSRQGRGSPPTRRSSHRSSGLRDDDSRTGSGLSESNRSAADSLLRSHSGRWSSIAAGTAGLFGGAALLATAEPGKKPGSSSSSSYNTARSGFGALQAEGPSLLLQGRTTTPSSPFEDGDLPEQPSSPSKSKPRRSWLGSLKRVFSTSDSASGASSSQEHSPRRTSAEMLSGDYEPPPPSALNSELLRRKQGRQDWEGGQASNKNSNGGAAAAAAGENEWDIEKAVEQRLVQIMFTVPRERLRVVNGDDDDDNDTGDDEKQPLHQPHTAELVDPDKSPSRLSMSMQSDDDGDDDGEGGGGAPVADGERDDGFLRIGGRDDYEQRRLSHSTDGSFARSAAAAVFTAEAMTLARPKTRVLQMVDAFESRSMENSPASSRVGSPARSVKSKPSLREDR